MHFVDAGICLSVSSFYPLCLAVWSSTMHHSTVAIVMHVNVTDNRPAMIIIDQAGKLVLPLKKQWESQTASHQQAMMSID